MNLSVESVPLGSTQECYLPRSAGMLKTFICIVSTICTKELQRLGSLEKFTDLIYCRYCVPSEHKEAFDDIIKEKFGLLFIKNPNLLHNIVLTMNPLELVKRNVN